MKMKGIIPLPGVAIGVLIGFMFVFSVLHTTSGAGIILKGNENIFIFAGGMNNAGKRILRYSDGSYYLDLGYISPGYKVVYTQAFAIVNENPHAIKILTVKVYPGYLEKVSVLPTGNTDEIVDDASFPYWIGAGDGNPYSVTDIFGKYVNVSYENGLFILNTSAVGSDGNYGTKSNFVWFQISIFVPDDSAAGSYSGRIVIVFSQ